LCCKQLSNSRKEALSFLQGCQFVVGPAALPVNENICPDALTDNAVRNTCLVLSRFYPLTINLPRPAWDKHTKQFRDRGGFLNSMQALYQAAYTRLTDVLSPSQFPRVTNWPVSKLPEGRLCEASYDYAALTVTWPDWNNPPPATTSDTNSDTAAAGAAAAAAGCHRVDESSGTVDFALSAGGDLDAMCFACVCSLGLPSLDDSEASTGEDGAAAGVPTPYHICVKTAETSATRVS
jgi:hypothetical protein